MNEDKYLVILTDDSLEMLKAKMNVNPYTDEQLNKAAMWYTSPTMYLASQLGAADGSQLAIFTTANLFARTVMAEYVNKGLLSISAIERYMKEAEALARAEEEKNRATAIGDSDGA